MQNTQSTTVSVRIPERQEDNVSFLFLEQIRTIHTSRGPLGGKAICILGAPWGQLGIDYFFG